MEEKTCHPSWQFVWIYGRRRANTLVGEINYKEYHRWFHFLKSVRNHRRILWIILEPKKSFPLWINRNLLSISLLFLSGSLSTNVNSWFHSIGDNKTFDLLFRIYNTKKYTRFFENEILIRVRILFLVAATGMWRTVEIPTLHSALELPHILQLDDGYHIMIMNRRFFPVSLQLLGDHDDFPFLADRNPQHFHPVLRFFL